MRAAAGLRDGPFLPLGERKSVVKLLAARTDPPHAQARHESMHHFAATAPCDEADLLRVARDHAFGQLERSGPVAACVVDAAYPKNGRHSVGLAAVLLGKQYNSQVAVTVSSVAAEDSFRKLAGVSRNVHVVSVVVYLGEIRGHDFLSE